MVCKKSLYCWKYGPCASEQTRKQIWEDNIRFRESLRDINQSDHYWSFQIYKNRCLCLEGEDEQCERPISRKYRSASLQRLHDINCTSITHDCNGLKFRNCFVHCPIHDFNKNSEIKRAITPVSQLSVRKDNSLSSKKHPFHSLYKAYDDKNEYCPRYKNTLVNSQLKPEMKTKFLSQSNLSSLNESKNLINKKNFYSSCEDISKVKAQEGKGKPFLTSNEKVCNAIDKKREIQIQAAKEKNNDKISDLQNKTTNNVVQTNLGKHKKAKYLKPVNKFSNQNKIHDFSPISRTTKKMYENKKVPFATYGCNNSNIDIGSKLTHNVLASKLEVYPNALSAKQQKKDLIMKCLQSEKEFQKRCLPEEFQRKINHSSLWSTDINKKEIKSLPKKSNKYLLPVMNKPLKKINTSCSHTDSGHIRTYHKPQIYFY